MVVLSEVFEEFYVFGVIMEPFQTSFLALKILNTVTPCISEY